MLYVMIRLGHLVEDEEEKVYWNNKAKQFIENCTGSIEKTLAFSSFFLIGMMNFLDPPTILKFYSHPPISTSKAKKEDNSEQKKIEEFIEKINTYYLPDALLTFLEKSEDMPEIESHSQEISVEVCKGFSCKGKIKTPEALEDL